MIKVSICDDDQGDCLHAEELTREFMQLKHVENVSIDTFDNPTDMLAEIDGGRVFDLILCDIYMPGLLGTEAIQELRDDDNVHVVFLTTSADHAYEAFGLHADGYLVKPYTMEQFSTVLGRVLTAIEKERRASIPIKARDGLHRLSYDDMMSAETSDHDQVIHLQNKATVSTRSSSQALFNRLSQDGRFFKAGSSYILNLDNVRSIQGRDVTFVNGEAITVPARSRKELEDAFFDFSFEGI